MMNALHKTELLTSLFTGTAFMIHLFLNNAHLTLPPPAGC